MSLKNEQTDKAAVRFKKEIMVVAFVVSLLGFFWGAITLNNWLKFGQYRKLASEVSEVLGGVDKRSDNWNCSISSVNCPSIVMTRREKYNNDKAVIQKAADIKTIVLSKYVDVTTGECSAENDYSSCEVAAKSDKGLKMRISIRTDGYTVDINP